MNQLVFDRSEHEFMSNRSSFAELVHFFEISTIFVDAFFHKSICWHQKRTREILCSFRVCCTFLINRHYKTDIKSKKTKNSARFRFTSRTIRSFFDSLRKSWSDRTKNCWFSRWFSSKFFSFSCRESIWHVTSCQRRSLRSSSTKWSLDWFSLFIRCESVRWKVSKSFQLIDFFDISWTCRAVIDAFSLFTKSSCSR
jgi:hypothetical protein